MDTKTILFSVLVVLVLVVFAWLNPVALDYKFALLIVSAFLIIGGFISREAITNFVKTRLNIGMPLDKTPPGQPEPPADPSARPK